ncbi:MAG: ribbon-helix-helix protein, CopG family [bacterium]|nr:ribbon-helix-helix protein, CopG family [bacterium]
MKSKSISIRFDDETYKIAEKLAKLSNLSISEMIKEMIKSKKSITEPRISRSIRKISGIIKTDIDYKELRDMIVDEKTQRYESPN